jgi:Domain of unknown function (DUF1924)
MMKIPALITALLLGATSTGLHAGTVTDVQNSYRDQGAGPFAFDRGERLWNSRQSEDRQCADCHGKDLTQTGQHQRTHKPIDAMAPSVTPARFTDLKKVEKWFKRNCKWTWGRECTAQEKGDLLEYLKRL